MATILIEQNQCHSIRIVDYSTNWKNQESQNFWGCLQKRGNKYKPKCRVGTKTVPTLPGWFYSLFAAPSTGGFERISPTGAMQGCIAFFAGAGRPFEKPRSKPSARSI
jgi:hypothetical protein